MGSLPSKNKNGKYLSSVVDVFTKYVWVKTLKEKKDKTVLKVGLSPCKKSFFICFSDSSSKMMKNAFYFILKALLVLKIFRFLSPLFGHVEKAAWLER